MDRQHIKMSLVSLLCILFLIVSCQNKGKEEAIYALRVGEIGDVILVQSSACLNQSKAYTAVWEYAKVTGEDFNSAARHMLGSTGAETKGQFMENKLTIENLLHKIENPPEKYKSAYEKLIGMHGLYLKLHDLSLKPTPPQEEYEASVNKLYDTLLKEAGELNTLLGR
jgi:hypothetical protein